MDSKVRSFQNLDVYKRLYKAMLSVVSDILPKIPSKERYDLTDRIRRASKAPLAIIAEIYILAMQTLS